MILDSMLKEKLDFYSKYYSSAEARLSLHPIDRLLLINAYNSSISFRWFNTLKLIGIDYNTPYTWINSSRDWNKYFNSINNVLLVVSNNAFMIASNNELIAKSGKIAKAPEIRKDKLHINSGRLLFTYKISYNEYIKEVFNKFKEE